MLIVEDERKLADGIARGLAFKGYAADIIEDGKKALTRISLHRSDYDLIILDLMLPGMDGFEVCSAVRALGHFPSTSSWRGYTLSCVGHRRRYLK